MPDTDVKIKILVDDAQVKQGEASINRLKAASDKLGTGTQQTLTQQEKLARFLGKDVPDAANKAASGMAEVENASAGAGEAMAGAGVSGLALAGGIGILVVALVAAVAVTVTIAKEVANLAAQFAKYSIEVGNSAEQNGLATSTIVALNNEVQAGGRKFVDYTGAVANFRKEIGQAAAGSVEAKKQLALLGLDGTTAINNIDGAFKVAIARIVAAPTEVEKIKLAFAAFGDEGYKLIPFFQQFGGNVDAAIKKAEELGLVVSGKDVDAAREFNRAYTEVENQITGIKNQIGREFGPVVRDTLKDFSSWLGRNKNDIIDLATSVGNAVVRIVQAFESIVKWVDDHPEAVGLVKAFFNYAVNGSVSIATPASTSPIAQNTLPKSVDYSRPQDVKIVADPEAIAKKIQELQEQTKRNVSATIEYWTNEAQSATRLLSNTAADLLDQFKTTGDQAQFAKGVNDAVLGFAASVGYANQQLNALEKEQADVENKNDAERAVIAQKQVARSQLLNDTVAKYVREANDKTTEYLKKTSADQIKIAEDEMRAKIQLSNDTAKHQIDDLKYLYDTDKSFSEDAYLKGVGAVQLDALRAKYIAIKQYIDNNKLSPDQQVKAIADLKKAEADIAQQETDNARVLTAEKRQRLAVEKEIFKLEHQTTAEKQQNQQDQQNEEKLQLLKEIQQLTNEINIGGANDQYVVEAEHLKDILAYRQQELNAVIEINRAQEELSHSMEISENQIKAAVLDHLAQQKTLNQAIAAGINETYDALATKLDDQIDKLFSWAGAFKSLFTEPLKALARNNLTNLTTSLLDAIAPGLGDTFKEATANPIAKPIVTEIQKTNRLLGQLVGASGQIPSLGGLNLGSIFGGSAGGGIFNLSGGGGGISGIGGGAISAGASGASGGGLGGIFGRIVGPGGIFGSQGFGNNVGTYGGIGALGGVVGGAIGGRVGGLISSTASGLAIGAQIGSIIPGIGTAIGAVVGAAVGFFAGLFGGDPNKKKDKNENLPALNKGFSDAFTQLNKILNDIRHLNMDPDEAIKEAGDIRAQIAGGFGIQFLSKKYQKVARQQIASNLVQADSIIDQIKASAEIARGAADRSKRILPEFAGGTYFADFFRPNGLVPGTFDGADNILAMISRGEMVLNPAQQNRVRALAGGDVFAGAGIPNYPKASASPKLATGGIAGAGLASATATPIVIQPNFTLIAQGVTFSQDAKVWVQSDDGKRTLAKFIVDNTNASIK